MNQLAEVRTNRPALRLVSTKDLSRDEWLNVRKRGIGSSDAATAVGLNPYQSALELWMIKTGREQALPKQEVNDESSPMYWGSLLEPIVAAHYTKKSGNRVRKINSVLQHPDPDKAWMLANLDYLVVGSDEVQVLECKTAGEFGARLWREGVPEYVQCQVQHQLAVTGKSAADVCVLVCGQEIRIYRIERDDILIERLIELERRFWSFVESDTPPPVDGSESSAFALQCLFPLDSGDTLDFTADRTMSSTFADLVTIRNEIDSREKIEAELKQTIQQKMGTASRATFETGTVSWKRSKDSVVLDMSTALREIPDLISKYPLVRPGNRRFLIAT
ncbi:YqaJ viral recombinase family protein [Undibacterium seohonense]|uniref:YqaJ viral recombinase family protein n=1 Tax=Undibacterium seohonense TaxID=1344950 RepID=A0ABR6X9D8_9BURK|nr:YqaJ viral recombinase family protein [Undibacterium seohonense]MBC3809273.1 YqaJ viral recombinase family protein [Undibacterium seohonense]